MSTEVPIGGGRRGDRSLRAPIRFPATDDPICDDGNSADPADDLPPMLHRLPPSSTEPAPCRARRAGSIAGRAVTGAAMVLLPLAMAACGGGDSSSSSSAAPLSAAAERGRSTAINSGCASCHGPTWQGGVAPSWIGLAGSTVTLSDGSTVTADAAYLTRSITAPADQKVEGYSIVMPLNLLTADEVADVVAFIQALTPSEDE